MKISLLRGGAFGLGITVLFGLLVALFWSDRFNGFVIIAVFLVLVAFVFGFLVGEATQ